MVSFVTLVIPTLALLPHALGNLIYTPVHVVQCVAHDLTWTGVPPFILDVWPGCDSDSDSADPLYTYHTNSTKATWTVNVKAGHTFMLSVTDAKGKEAYTDDVLVKQSNITSCLGKPAVFIVPNSSPPVSPPVSSSLPAGPPGNVEASPTSTTTKASAKPGGALGNGGARSAFSPRVDVSALVLLASILAGCVY